MSNYPLFFAVVVDNFQSLTQPISGYRAGYRRTEAYAVKMTTGPRCKGFISVQRYKDWSAAQKAAARKRNEHVATLTQTKQLSRAATKGQDR